MSGSVSLELTLRNVEDSFIEDTKTIISLERTGDTRVVGTSAPLDFSHGAITIEFKFKSPNIGWYRCRILPTLYHAELRDFSAPDRSDVVRMEVTLTRRAEGWQAQFVPWARLSPRFDMLRALLVASPRILFVETGEEITGFVEDKYDGVGSGPAVLAKATLLNLYCELSVTYEPMEGVKPFLSFVRSIEALGRDCVLTLADSALAEVLATIEKKEDTYPDWHVRGVDMQHFYLPAPYRARVAELRHLGLRSLGNTLDISLATLRNADFVVAAFAITEGAKPEPVGHVLLEAGRQFSGDARLAHPFEVHEWLKWASRTVSGPVADLGYQLVPL